MCPTEKQERWYVGSKSEHNLDRFMSNQPQSNASPADLGLFLLLSRTIGKDTTSPISSSDRIPSSSSAATPQNTLDIHSVGMHPQETEGKSTCQLLWFTLTSYANWLLTRWLGGLSRHFAGSGTFFIIFAVTFAHPNLFTVGRVVWSQMSSNSARSMITEEIRSELSQLR